MTESIGVLMSITAEMAEDMDRWKDPASHQFRDVGLGLCLFCSTAEPGHFIPTPEQQAQWAAEQAERDAARERLYSTDVSDLSLDEAAAIRALYADLDLEVGSEGIGGFYAGQAEAVMRTLRKGGFRVVPSAVADAWQGRSAGSVS